MTEEAVKPEVLEDGEGTYWVSARHTREEAAKAITDHCNDPSLIPLDEAIPPEDVTLVGFRPPTAEDLAKWGDEIVDVECPLDHPNKSGEWWRWAE